MKQSLLLASSILLIAVGSHAEPASQVTREYRALEANKITWSTGAKTTRAETLRAKTHPREGEARSYEEFKRLGWASFDQREWKKATDHFLSALERNPESTEMAEALAVSLYRSGDYRSAYRLGKELSRIVPSVHRIIAETARADVRFMIQRGEFEAASEFLAHFPGEDPAFAATHRLLEGAATITMATAPDGDRSLEPGQAPGRPLVQN